MSLPPLLLARLKKRGIIKGKDPAEEEEVFAESYDREEDEQADAGEKHRGGAPGCPNKNNHYHVCSDFCFDHWREGFPEHRLSERYLQQRQKVLKLYPLPAGWKEVYDAGMQRHYYWCQSSDEVSWLPPKHPRAVISEPAAKLAKALFASMNIPTAGVLSVPSAGGQKAGDRSRTVAGSERSRGSRSERYRGPDSKRRRRDGSVSGDEAERRSPTPEVELNDRDRLKRAKRKGIDPMDPAAYGDAPVGSWAAGLTADVKTGADVTANGPLFQQRPYPAPGAILRRNNPDFDKNHAGGGN